ncbi:helix-turn-helix transcriptional regulator [Microlunatus parietis]
MAVTAVTGDALAALADTSIAQALKLAREEAGLSASALARAAETSRAAIHAYETGIREPTVSTALRLLRVCGCTMEVIHYGRSPGAQSSP